MFLEHKECEVCKTVTPHHNGNCARCASKKAKEAERMWEAQDTDTKLTDIRKRIEKLERDRFPARF